LLFLGWSIGGAIAFEVARQLIASGISVPGLVLIDSPHPETTTPLSVDVLNTAFSTKKSSSRVVELARSSIQYATAALVEYNPSSSPAHNILPRKAVMLRSCEAFNVKGLNPSSQSDAFLTERSDPATVIQGWEKLLGTTVPVLDIPGNHFEPFDPRYVSAHLKCPRQTLV
jgi:thioesterase domain-containing protein